MYCEKCGSKLKDSDIYCPNCGHSKTNGEVKTSSNAGLIFGVIAILTLWMPLVSIPCAIVAIVKGRKSNTGVVILGVVSLVLSILITLIISALVFFGFLFVSNSDDVLDRIDSYVDRFGDRFDSEEFYDGRDIDDDTSLSGKNFRASDGSLLLLKEDSSYFWYKNNDMDENNYSYGNYEVYNGFKAISYIVRHLKEFDIPYNDKSSFDDSDYDIDEFYVLILNCNKNIIDGKESNKENSIYYGFYDDGKLKLINVKDSKEINFILSDKKNNGDTV